MRARAVSPLSVTRWHGQGINTSSSLDPQCLPVATTRGEKNWSQGQESGRVDPTLPCLPCGGMCEGKMPSTSLPLATCVRQESWPCPSLALAPGRLRHALLLGSTLELNLLVGALVLWAREQESCPCPSLIYHVVVWAREVGNSPLSHLLPPATGRRAGLQAREQKNWPCPSPTETVWKQGPAAYLDKQ